jgi:hypothetical protein
VESELPTVTVTLWRADAIVLFDWLNNTDLNTVPVREFGPDGVVRERAAQRIAGTLRDAKNHHGVSTDAVPHLDRQ